MRGNDTSALKWDNDRTTNVIITIWYLIRDDYMFRVKITVYLFIY